jgi:ribosomal protein S6
MPDWIAKANIEHFKRLLETEKDLRRRTVIERELAEEEAKLAALKKGERKEG